MRNVKRFDPEGRPVFITQACKDRVPALAGMESLLLAVIQELREATGCKILARVILPDHLHLIVIGGRGFSSFMQSMKLRSVRRAGQGRFWQDRFHDHVIRDDRDLRNHLDYLHYNPVHHGYTSTPEAYPFTSFRQYQTRGLYLPGWGHRAPDNIGNVDVE